MQIGIKLRAYEVIAKLGEGGMGEVYRARDAKLGRDVALKILPAMFANDPDRLMRFEREAKLLASLNAQRTGSTTAAAVHTRRRSVDQWRWPLNSTEAWHVPRPCSLED